ncbi:hypothetical protein KEM54_003051 [Ascosphaera aggregata]|nr:hypothetical protein KEM54_003051 [Ascosphaera aggregata]
MRRSCSTQCALIFYAALRRYPEDPRTTSMRCIQVLLWCSSVVGLAIICTTLVLGIHLQLQLDSAGQATAQIAASIVGVLTGSLPYALPYIVTKVTTWWCQWRTGVSDYDISSHEQSVIARRIFQFKIFIYLVATTTSLIALILWMELPASKLHSGKTLSLGSHCGEFPQSDDPNMIGSVNPIATVDSGNNASGFCDEGRASFLLLCAHMVCLATELLLETLIYFLPSKAIFRCSNSRW